MFEREKKMRLAVWIVLVCGLVLSASPLRATELDPVEGYRLLFQLMSEEKKERKQASDVLIKAGDVSLVPGMVDAMFFTPRLYRAELMKTLKALTGESSTLYRDWITYVGEHEEIEPKARYGEWKAAMFRRIDPRYSEVFYPGAPSKIRLQEVISGGVPLDGIPSVDDPPLVDASAASYMQKNERVFGVELGGEAVAFPLRFLSWHEMLNGEVGGEPVTLSFCTLCGSGILYSRRVDDEILEFGTSGLLYRSNKLMYDRTHKTLWSNLTGEAVVGKKVASGDRLKVLPMTLTTWDEWRRRHPDTRTIDLKALQRQMGESFRFEYSPGAAERAREGVSFPVWKRSEALGDKDEVYVLKIGNDTKAYPLDIVLKEGIVHDQIGTASIVLVADAESKSVRAYVSGESSFRRDGEDRLVDADGRSWTIGELALESDGEPPLGRVPGHVAFWFGWYAFYPDTEIYRGS